MIEKKELETKKPGWVALKEKIENDVVVVFEGEKLSIPEIKQKISTLQKIMKIAKTGLSISFDGGKIEIL